MISENFSPDLLLKSRWNTKLLSVAPTKLTFTCWSVGLIIFSMIAVAWAFADPSVNRAAAPRT
jgi:hypothetical protein